jgi:phosphate transport system substrate-binding protein
MKATLLSVVGLSLAAVSQGEVRLAVDTALPSYRATGVKGALKIVGPEWLARPVKAVAEGFIKLEPGANIEIAALSDEEARRALPTAAPVVIRYDEFLNASELAEFKKAHGYEPLAVRFAEGHFERTDGPTAVAVFVPKDNPLDKLTLAQLDAIFSQTRRRGYPEDLTTWGQLGLTGEWADKPIHLYGRNVGHHVYLYFEDRVLKGGAHKTTYQGKEPSPAAIAAIAGDRYGIGYVSMGRATPEVRKVALAETEQGPYVLPEPETVANGTYPLVRYLWMFVDRARGKPVDPVAKAFLQFAWSREGQEIALQQGYVPIRAKALEEERARLD